MEPADPADPRTWTLQRVVGHGAAWSLLLPPAARALAPAARRLAGEDVLLNALAAAWLPTRPTHAGALGVFGGALEDYHCRVAYDEARLERRLREPRLWTARTLVPSLLFFAHPALAWCALDGELVGSNCALAALEGRPVRRWPFFAVLDAERPSADGRCCRARYLDHRPASEWALLYRRVSGGYYEVERRPENSRWEVL